MSRDVFVIFRKVRMHILEVKKYVCVSYKSMRDIH